MRSETSTQHSFGGSRRERRTMRYPCLVLDHDDTVVNSTATIHFPAFNAYMKDVRPDIHFTLGEYFELNFEPGVIPLFRDICGLSEEEMRAEEAFWRNYVNTRIPQAYPGLPEILWKYKRSGGTICVVSHSFSEYILRDYAANDLPEPDLIFGWDMEPENRKPSPYSIYEIERICGFGPEEMLILDDLKPGYDMARAAGVTFAAAGWANDVAKIESFMRENCDFYCKTVEDFAALIGEQPDRPERVS